VVFIALNQHNLGPQERLLAFSDKNRDLFVAQLGGGGGGKGAETAIPVLKLHAQVESFIFNDETDALVGLADGRLCAWYQPGVAFVNRDLLPLTSQLSEASEYGRGAVVTSFTSSRVSVRKADGSLTFGSTLVEVPLLYELARASRWGEAMRLCRHQKSRVLWGCLAAQALSKKQLDTAEQALAELDEVAKVRSSFPPPLDQGDFIYLSLFISLSNAYF
jgi:hypothetical protein